MTTELNRFTRIKSLLQDTKLIDSHTISSVVAECDAVIFAQRPAAQTEREAWVPYLVDRADGVKGHYAIGRWNPRGYREVWNLHTHRWAAFSDDVMSLEEADSLLRQITIPTARASLPTQPAAQATPEPVPADQAKWCEYVAGMVDCWINSHWPHYNHMDEERRVKAIAGIIERRLWALQTQPATPAQQAAGEPVGEVDQIDIDEDGQAHAWVVLHDNVTIGTKLYDRPAPGVPEVAREALERIASWNEHPAMLGVDYGSNGVRDYYRKIARDALAAAQAKGGEQ